MEKAIKMFLLGCAMMIAYKAGEEKSTQKIFNIQIVTGDKKDAAEDQV